MQPSREILDDLVQRIVSVAAPTRVILFGSAARGTMGPDSDLDVMVVMRDGIHRRRMTQLRYRALAGIGMPKDLVVVTESDVVQLGDDPSLVIKPALGEGIELYRAG